MADISITAANFIPSASATLVNGTAGGSVTRCMPLYYDSASNTWKQCVVSSTTTDNFGGFACEDAASGQPITVVAKDPALVLGGTVSTGDTIWLSATGVTKTQADLITGWRIWFIGVGNAGSPNMINFNPTKGGIK